MKNKKLVLTVLFISIFTISVSANTSLFSDVSQDSWYSQAVNSLAEKDIVKGYESKYKPNDNVTRAEMAQIIYNYDNYRKTTVDKVLRSSVMIKNDTSLGSGVIVSNEYILTVKHVVKDIKIYQDIDFYYGEATGSFNITLCDYADLALIKINGIPPTAKIAKIQENLLQGDEVYVCGNAQGYRFSLTKGIVSHLGRYVDNSFLLQVDASVNSGNSGGAIFSSDGDIIGLVQAKIVGDGIEGLGFGVTPNVLKRFLTENNVYN